jgi:hypothetical protein
VTVHLNPTTGGRITSLREPVQVFAPDAFERELQARWPGGVADLDEEDRGEIAAAADERGVGVDPLGQALQSHARHHSA